jgi:SPX domain protein involved in polyphosphate accumulation
MPLWETAATALAGGVGGGLITVGAQQILRRRNAPALTLDWYSNQATSPVILTRIIDKQEVQFENISDTETRHKAKDIHLLLENTGRTPVRECQVKAEIYEGGSRNPQPVRLGTRINPLILYEGLSKGEQIRERTASFQVNRNDSVLIDLLRLSYEEIDDRNNNKTETSNGSLHTLASFRRIEFVPNTKYTLHVTVTAANAKPAKFGLTLQWDGSVEDHALQDALNKTDPDVVYF